MFMRHTWKNTNQQQIQEQIQKKGEVEEGDDKYSVVQRKTSGTLIPKRQRWYERKRDGGKQHENEKLK